MTSIKFRALTHNEQKLFFEALGEHGKDFQNIQQYMYHKSAKLIQKSTEQNKSSITTLDPQEKRDQDKKEEDKKREQIRNFYNKLYAKLSQLIGKLDDRVEKVNQELYLLINYGEIWKKYCFKYNNNKTKKLLEELVYQGYTTIRYKNKNVRLRTPSCKALKKINKIGIDEEVKVVTSRELPKDVIVEFQPATNRDWLKVQSMSQNPRVRAKLSMQKRISNVLEFLENKWNISQEKLNRTVDVWLKVPPCNQTLEDSTTSCSTNLNTLWQHENNLNQSIKRKNINTNEKEKSDEQNCQKSEDIFTRLRLKPSSQHELKEVNITRVIPDNHLDLSLQAYIKRLEECGVKPTDKDPNLGTSGNSDYCPKEEVFEGSQGCFSNTSRLPISLTTPDSSILLERSMTSDQPSIAQARKHLNILQSLAGSFGGGENSRMACDDTQDRSLLSSNHTDSLRTNLMSYEPESVRQTCSNVLMNNSIPELFDENAAIDSSITKLSSDHAQTCSQNNSDSQNSRSLDFPHIPKNLTLGDWFKMAGQNGAGDCANDSFSTEQPQTVTCDNVENVVETEKEKLSDIKKAKGESANGTSLAKQQNHMIEIKRFAEGWTIQDECPLTIGELYLAFKCPEKILLEYGFEQFKYVDPQDVPLETNAEINGELENRASHISVIPEESSSNTLIFKLLTAASLSLAQIERKKQEQQHKLHDQPGAKFKRRKGPSNPNTIRFLKRDDAFPMSQFLTPTASGNGSIEQNSNVSGHKVCPEPGNGNYLNGNSDKQVQGQIHTMTLHDIETTNQRVEEALKLLQPTRLGVFRRAR